eukprot:CAMPEP_0198254356 /NCGR_PEP_ID=MMETSP1447-20131203/4665_1 /TAXON_ID=420782 /ORGANISM="Chaetoceros dichaeta, Strain CCMP1751" /LENGTH=295 /DNA_ID=CAMNT_0043940365 /DNA_START=112 /DNA_END=999 /DNA_ORIENTATION=+
MKLHLIHVPLLFIVLFIDVEGFQVATSLSISSTAKVSSTVLYRAFHKKNKQAELLKKLNNAKEKRENDDGTDEPEKISSTSEPRLSDEDMKKANDLKRFEQLLSSNSGTMSYELDGDGTNYLTKKQEEDDIDAGFQRVNRLFEGDPAPSEPFQDLVSIQTDLALGEAGAKRIVPSNYNDYLVIISDPRTKSSQLRDLMTIISTGIPNDILSNIVVINSDTTAENRKWLKKRKLTNLKVFSDEKREWMREYTALGEERWAICMFIIADGRVQKLVRELDANVADKVVKGAINSLVN